MPGSGYHPLDVTAPQGETSELERFREAAKSGPPVEEYVGLVAADTGLRASAIAHSNSSWFVTEGNELYLDVPQYSECILGTGLSGRGGDTTDVGHPCSDCIDRTTDEPWLPPQKKLPDNGDCWKPKSEAGYKGRKIPIKEDDTAQIIRSYFAVHDRVMATGNISDVIKRIADRAGLLEVTVNENGSNDYWPTTHDLRDTFGTMLAEKGFTRDQIKSAMGHEHIDTADDYVELSGRATSNAFDDKW